jgi:hypothetical protein
MTAQNTGRPIPLPAVLALSSPAAYETRQVAERLRRGSGLSSSRLAQRGSDQAVKGDRATADMSSMVLKRSPAAGLAAGAAIIGLVLLLSSGGRHNKQTPSPASPPAALRASSFTTSYETGWRLTTKRSPTGAARYALSSSRTPPNSLGIPPAGALGITIDEIPISLAKSLHLGGAAPDAAAARQSMLTLLPHAVGTPARAEHVARVAAPHAVLLDGAQAAEEAYTYRYAGRENVQVDVLSRHQGRLFLVELDAEPSLAQASRSALAAVTGGWRWG